MTAAIANLGMPHLTDSYLALIRRFPLRPIRTRADYHAAAAVLDELVMRGEASLSKGERDYLEALEILIEDHDRRHLPEGMERRTPLERLRYLLDANDMKPADLGRLLGSSGLASDILNGRRQLSKTHIRKLAERFSVDAGYFL